MVDHEFVVNPRTNAVVWTQVTKFTPGTGSQSLCGSAVAIIGSQALVGAISHPSQPSITHQLTRTGMNTWIVSGPALQGGASIAVVGNPPIVALGHPKFGSVGVVHLYALNVGLITTLGITDGMIGDEFGSAVAFDETGDALVVGARSFGPLDIGCAYLFEKQNNLWKFRRRFFAPSPGPTDLYGTAVACYRYSHPDSDAIFALIGSPQDDVTIANQGSVTVQLVHDSDCNGSYSMDYCDIFLGASDDLNQNGVPDVCEPSPPCPADLSGGDGVINVFDLFVLLSNWNTAGPGAELAPPTNVADVFDLFVLLGAWGACP